MAKALSLGLLFLSLHAGFAADTGPASAFDTFKRLEGKWAIHSGGKTLAIEMTYAVGSKGSIVTEQFGKELSVIYRDGPGLLMTHFCNGGNVPRLRLQPNTAPGTLEFAMFDIANLRSANAAHVEKIVYTITGDRTMNLEIVWRTGKSLESERYSLTRL